MQANPATMIAEIIHHTPPWVWAIAAAITVLGLLQCRQRRVSLGGLLLTPIAMGAYSLWGAGSAFGAAAVPGWLAGMVAVLLAGRSLQRRRATERAADGRFVLHGSPWPLLLMWAVFALRYAVAVVLALHPGALRGGAAAIGLTALYGALSGLFAARAWRVLQSADWPAPVRAA